MFITKKRLLEEVRKAKLEGIEEGKQELKRQLVMNKERGIKEGYNRGFTDRTNYYTMSVIPEKEKKDEKIITSYKKIINKYKERNLELRNKVANYEVANKSLREIGERLMFRVSELKDEKEELEDKLNKLEDGKRLLALKDSVNTKAYTNLQNENDVLREKNNDLDNYNTELICQLGSLQMDLAEQEEVQMNNDLYDFQEIKRLEELMKKVKRVKVKKKIQSRIDKLMIKGL